MTAVAGPHVMVDIECQIVRADEVRLGQLLWETRAEHEVLRVRDLSAERLELTVHRRTGPLSK
jgi:hypothetical protein